MSPIKDDRVISARHQLAARFEWLRCRYRRLARIAMCVVFAMFAIAETSNAQRRLPSPETAELPAPQLELAPADGTWSLPPVAESLPEPPADNSAASDIEVAPESKSPTMEEFQAVLKRLEELEKGIEKPSDVKEKEDKVLEPQWIDMSNDKWNVKLGGHMQLDDINWADASPQIPEFNYIEFRRLRLLADGTGYGVLDFRLQIDIEPESEDPVVTPVTAIKDAYLTVHDLPYFNRARIGNFFVPFGLEQVINDTQSVFLERSIPTQGIFTADREIGIASYNISKDQNFTWTFGVFVDGFSDGLKERIDDNQGQRISGRITYLPYYDEPSNGRYMIHTGAGVLYTHDQDNLVRFRSRPEIHEGPFLIDTGPRPSSYHTTGNLEFALVWGSFSLQSEAYLSHVNLLDQDAATVGGAYIYASYFLTGDNRQYERFGQHGAQFTRPRLISNAFWVPGCCSPGAWELKARCSNLTLNEMNAGSLTDISVGVNWYWNDRVRVMFDWIHPMTSAGSTPFGKTTSDIIGMRFDYGF